LPVEESNPVVKRSVSPGKKKPKNTPFSAKIIRRIKNNPPDFIITSGLVIK
jgi:hypothetical protein